MSFIPHSAFRAPHLKRLNRSEAFQRPSGLDFPLFLLPYNKRSAAISGGCIEGILPS